MSEAIFVSLSGVDGGVFESQVMELGESFRSMGVEFRYLLFEGLRTGVRSGARLKQQLADLSRRFDARLELRYLPGPLSRPGLRLAAHYLARAAQSVASGRVLVQARGAPAACAALEAKRRVGAIAVVYDARSDEAAEARLEAGTATTRAGRSRWERRANRLEVLQQHAAAGADHVLAVSKPLRDRLCTLAEISTARVSVVPCCVNPTRFVRPLSTRQSTRRRLHLEDRFVFVYSGSLQLWQIPDRIAALMTSVQAQLPAAHLLVLTRDRTTASRFFGNLLKQDSATIQDCPFETVGDYLAAADAALLLRENDAVNRVACPVKFAEYQVSGLPVIATPGIGDVSDYVLQTGHGLLIRLDETPQQQASQIVRALNEGRWRDKTAIVSDAVKMFSRESYRGVYHEILSALGVSLGCVTNEPNAGEIAAREECSRYGA